MKIILEGLQLKLTIERLAYQILEENPVADDTVFIGIQPEVPYLATAWCPYLTGFIANRLLMVSLILLFTAMILTLSCICLTKPTLIFRLTKKNVVLIDDVLYTGRTIRSAMDALIDFGRPKKVELCVLVDRRFNRELPIQPDFTGRTIDTIFSQRVVVNWSPAQPKDEVLLADSEV